MPGALGLEAQAARPAALRRAGERYNGGALPESLDSAPWLARLLARRGRDAASAERTLAGALRPAVDAERGGSARGVRLADGSDGSHGVRSGKL